MKKKLRWFAFLGILMSCVTLLAQTSANRTYIYDPAGQLIGVIDEDGTRLTYTYDAAGNLLSVERLSARGAVDIFFLDPNQGRAAALPQRPGTPVTIHGVGFSAVPTENQVTFNGVAAVVDSSTATTIRTSVPESATTGRVQVTSPQGAATSRSDFTVITGIAVAVSPARIDVAVRQSLLFTATVTEGGRVIPGNVVWSVNGIVGGHLTVGTINQTGLYTAPASIPTPPTVTVTATSVEEPTSRAGAMVTIVQGIGPIFTAASHRADFRGMPIGPIAPLGASYRTDDRARPIGPIAPPGASYRTDPQANPLSAIFNQGSSYTTILVTGLDPPQVTRGAADVPFTVMGRHFNGATGLEFLLPSGIRDPNITAALLTINPEGTRITTRISVAGLAALSARTVVVRTPVGLSTTMVTEDNQLTVAEKAIEDQSHVPR